MFPNNLKAIKSYRWMYATAELCGTTHPVHLVTFWTRNYGPNRTVDCQRGTGFVSTNIDAILQYDQSKTFIKMCLET